MDALHSPTSEARRQSRAKMILAATWSDGSFVKPGRIRNMSSIGAMVECAFPPSVGACIVLNRGNLRAAASVVWSKDENFGVKFDSPIEVREWLVDESGAGGGESSLNRNSVHSYVKSAEHKQHERAVPEAISEDVLVKRLSEEIAYAARVVSSMTSVLANDPLLRNRHAVSLQELTVSNQSLAEIASIMQDSDKLTAVTRIATGPMRQRILRRGGL